MVFFLSFQIDYCEKRRLESLKSAEEISEEKTLYEDPTLNEGDNRRNFFKSTSKHTPEYRYVSRRHITILDFIDKYQVASEFHQLTLTKIVSRI